MDIDKILSLNQFDKHVHIFTFYFMHMKCEKCTPIHPFIPIIHIISHFYLQDFLPDFFLTYQAHTTEYEFITLQSQTHYHGFHLLTSEL